MGIVRPWTPQDAAACSRVVNAAVGMMDGLDDDALHHLQQKSTPERLAAELALYHTLVYVEDGQVAGVGALDGPEVKRLFVEPCRQGRGVGRELARRLEQEARALGFDALVVDAPLASAGFWRRLGFQTVQADTARWGDVEIHFVHMRRELATVPLGRLPIRSAELDRA